MRMDTDLSRCLLDSATPCVVSAPCPNVRWPRSCLTSKIPAWSNSTLARVHCCLRCCLHHWTARLGLDANQAHWRQRGVDFWVSSGAGTSAPSAPASLSHESEESAAAAAEMLYARFSLGRYVARHNALTVLTRFPRCHRVKSALDHEVADLSVVTQFCTLTSSPTLTPVPMYYE